MGRHAASSMLLATRSVDNAGERGLRGAHPRGPCLKSFPQHSRRGRSGDHFYTASAITLETYFKRYVYAKVTTLRDDAFDIEAFKTAIINLDFIAECRISILHGTIRR